jgi:hypothetical protein
MDGPWTSPACGELDDTYTKEIFSDYFSEWPEMSEPTPEVGIGTSVAIAKLIPNFLLGN